MTVIRHYPYRTFRPSDEFYRMTDLEYLIEQSRGAIDMLHTELHLAAGLDLPFDNHEAYETDAGRIFYFYDGLVMILNRQHPPFKRTETED